MDLNPFSRGLKRHLRGQDHHTVNRIIRSRGYGKSFSGSVFLEVEKGGEIASKSEKGVSYLLVRIPHWGRKILFITVTAVFNKVMGIWKSGIKENGRESLQISFVFKQ